MGRRSVFFLNYWVPILILLASIVPLVAQMDGPNSGALPVSSPGRTPERTPAYKSSANVVLVNVTVLDGRERVMTGLRAEDFSISDDKMPQRVKYFSSEDSPISLTILLDASGSMAAHMDAVQRAAIDFFRASNPMDELTVITFSDKPRVLIDRDEAGNEIEEALATLNPSGRTGLLDALHFTLNRMQRSRYSRKAVLLMSDGGDNQSRITESSIRSLLQESDTLVYAIDFFDPFPRTMEERKGPRMLDDLTSLSGGRLFMVRDNQELNQAIAETSEELRNQYVLGYVLDKSAQDGRWHHLKVKVNEGRASNLRSYARKGYYAPTP